MKARIRTALLPAHHLALIGLLAGGTLLQVQGAAPELTQPAYSATGVFQCQIIAEPGLLCEVQVSSDLRTWRTLAQIRQRGALQPFEDPAAVNFNPRFYRVIGPINDTSPGVARIFPSSASPGMSVRVTTDGPAFTEEGPNVIWINGLAVPALWIGSKDEAEVLVPNLASGKAVMHVRLQGRQPGERGLFYILPARTRLLVLAQGKEGIALLGNYPSGDQPSAPASRDERRLSLDIFNGKGGLIASCAVPHPALPIESFDDPDQPGSDFRRSAAPSVAVFAVKVPAVQGLMRIRCYDAEPGADLTDLRGRESRRFLNELELQ